MITAFNALLECFVTGLFTALCILGLTKIGLFPMLMMIATEEEVVEDE